MDAGGIQSRVVTEPQRDRSAEGGERVNSAGKVQINISNLLDKPKFEFHTKGIHIMEKKTLGSFISALRRAQGLTQQEVADRLMVSNRAVSR